MPLSVVGKAYGKEDSGNPHAGYLVDTRPMLKLLKDVSSATSINTMQNELLQNQVTTLTSLVKNQNMLILEMKNDMKELKELVGMKNKEGIIRKETPFEYIEDWTSLEMKFTSNMKHLIFHWFNSEAEQSINLAVDNKRNIVKKGSRIKVVVKKLMALASEKHELPLKPKNATVNELAGWKNRMKTFSEDCFNLSIDLMKKKNIGAKEIYQDLYKMKFTTLERLLKTLDG